MESSASRTKLASLRVLGAVAPTLQPRQRPAERQPECGHLLAIPKQADGAQPRPKIAHEAAGAMLQIDAPIAGRETNGAAPKAGIGLDEVRHLSGTRASQRS